MAVYAIGDLHLSGHCEKPMDIFGDHWQHHFDTITANWRAKIQDDDIVLIPGDISWAMQLEYAKEDLYAIAELPGRKVLLRGNHDYWWSSPAKIRAILPEGMSIIQNDALLLDRYAICGTRGWMYPTNNAPLNAEDEKIYRRELIRLDISLSAAKKLHAEEIIVMLHYPPLEANGLPSEFSRLIEENGARTVVYGHLHGIAIKNAYISEHNGTRYNLVSCDALHFSPLQIFA